MVQPEVRVAVAAAVRRADGLVLAVRRPDEPGEELPGVWGLPATTLRDGEPPEDGLRRLGREKLGVELHAVRPLGEGEQVRPDYTLRMTVYEASMAGEPRLPPRTLDSAITLYDAFDWLPAASLNEAAERGSLCCRLFLSALTPTLPRKGLPSPASGRGDVTEPRTRLRVSAELRRKMVTVARSFRKEPTKGEELLWQALRNRQLLSRKFRRQHPVGPFVADFYCAEALLVVEVDGPIHESQREADRQREELLESAGLRVLRVRTEDVETDLELVLAAIREALAF